MKVIKNKYKEPTSEYPKTIECPICFSIFLLENKDEIFHKREYISSEKEMQQTYGCIKCPCCQNEIKLSSLTPIECDRCDGCGWHEGGIVLKTICENCGGTGIIYKDEQEFLSEIIRKLKT